MRVVIQRVAEASVTVNGHRIAEIGAGLLVLLGIAEGDGSEQADQLADKVLALRVFEDEEGRMNEPLGDRELLCVPQFTLYGDAAKGRRPSWINAARPEHAEPLVESVCNRLKELGAAVATGRFRTDMQVEIVNDGPVTLMLEV